MPITNDLPRYDQDNLSSPPGHLVSYAWPGGYPVYYICKDESVLCADCANQQEKENAEQLADPEGMSLLDMDILVGYGLNYEKDDLYCDKCSQLIECAYCD